METLHGQEIAEPAALKTDGRRRKKYFLRWLRGGLLLYLMLCLGCSMFQSWLIFPGQHTQGKAASQHRPGSHEQLVELKSADGTRIVALFAPALRDDAKSRPTVMFFYGNGMCMADCVGLSRDFQRAGFNCLTMDYPGYGMSGGKPSEAAINAAAEACWDFLASNPVVDIRKIVPVGLSLGGGAAVEVASRHPVRGIVTISAFTSIDDMGRHLLPILPTRLILRNHFHNEQKLMQMQIPHLIIHGDRDGTIPVSMAHRLHKASRQSTLAIIPGGDHNDIFDIGGEEMMERIFQFIQRISEEPQMNSDEHR